MPFDYESNTSAIVNVLVNANTTTATVDLSSGLSTRVRNVFRFDPELGNIRREHLPAVFVRLNKKEEDFAGLGGTGPTGARKSATVIYDIIGIYQKDGMHTAHSTLTIEVQRLAENIEGVFQRDYTLSSTALWSNPRSTDFSQPVWEENTWMKGVVVELEAKYHFR